jgi:hypothetical protein
MATCDIPPPRNLLISYYYYRRKDIDRLAPCRIIADSGAYSAKQLGVIVTTRQLAAWTKIWNHRLCWVASLDIAGDTALTRTNWLRMVDQHQIPAVSTLHYGEPLTELDWYAGKGVDFVGLGGMAGGVNSPQNLLRWLVSVFKYARDNHPDMRFHGWGITHEKLLRLPFFSVDSSGWGSSYRYGRIALRDPRNGKQLGVELNGKNIYSNRAVCELLTDHYGVTPSEIAKAGPDNRILLVKLAALSASVQEQQMRKLHRANPVSPPKWGHLGGWDMEPGPNNLLTLGGCGAGIRDEKALRELHGLDGPHMHLVDGYPPHMQTVAKLARGEELIASDVLNTKY